VILAGVEDEQVSAINECEDRNFWTIETFFNEDAFAGVAECSIDHDSVDGSFGFLH